MFEEEQELEQQLTISDYLRIIYRGRWIISLSFVLIFLATVYYTFTSPAIYESTTTVLIESTGSMERSMFGPSYFGSQTTLITNQLEILKSRKLAERAIIRLGSSEVRDSLFIFQHDAEGNLMPFRVMVAWLQGNLEINHRKDTDVIEIKFSAGSPFECTYITNVVAEEFKFLNAETNKGEVNDLRIFLQSQLNKKEEELRAAENSLREYQEKNKVASLDDETTILVDRLAQAESMIEQAQVDLGASLERKQSLISQLDERKLNLADDLSEISTPYLLSLQNELAQSIAERTKFVVAIESDISNPNRLSYEGRIKAYDDKINALRQKLEDESKKIKTSGMVKDPFQLSQSLFTSLLGTETEIKSLTAKITALRDVVSDYESKLENLPLKSLELARLERNRKVKEETYIMMTSKLEETKIKEAGQSGSVRILDEAIEPTSPVSPKKNLNLMLGALIGLAVGLGLTFIIEYFDNSIKTIEEVERLGFNLLGAIPKIEQDKLEKKIKNKWDSIDLNEGKNIESRLITHFDPKSPISEAYRTLRTNIQFTKLDNPLKTILVTSSGPKEGKSTTIANLAITLSQLGSKVVLVDTDLRRPVIHSIFGLEKDKGLTNYMMDTVSYSDILKKSVIDNLSIITCGVLPPNPSELLGSIKMEEIINQLKSDFDIVLLDSPPVIAVTDAAILCSKVDGALLVISSGSTNRDAVIRAKSLLENVNARVVGALLNNVDVDSTYGSSYYYYYYHYYYGAHPKKNKNMRKMYKAES